MERLFGSFFRSSIMKYIASNIAYCEDNPFSDVNKQFFLLLLLLLLSFFVFLSLLSLF